MLGTDRGPEVVVVRLRLRGAHVVDERVQHVRDVLERGHVQHRQLLRVLGAVRAQQRQAVRQELAPRTARFHACWKRHHYC